MGVSELSSLLNKGEKAPFAGVLVPEYQYREMSADILEKDILKKQMLEPKPEESFSKLTFIAGVLTGFVGAFVIHTAGGNK